MKLLVWIVPGIGNLDVWDKHRKEKVWTGHLFNLFLFFLLFIWLHQVLVAAGGLLSCGSPAP